MKRPMRVFRDRALMICVLAMFAATATAGASAQTQSPEGAGRASDDSQSRRVNIGVGRSIILDLPRDASEIFVADPKVANAVVRSARRLYIIAQQSGQTSIFAMDKEGHKMLSIELSVGRDIAELGNILKIALPNSNIVARTVNDSIILTGMVDSASDVQTANDLAKAFADNINKGGGERQGGIVVNALTMRGRDQVMLKVTIAEVQRNVLKQLGVTGAIARGSWGAINMQNTFPVNGALSQGATNIGNFAGMSAVPVAGASPIPGFSAQISAYERYGVAKILAEPSVTAVSGESAKFLAGGSIPVPSGQNCVTGGVCTTGINYQSYGVSLNFTPLVLAEGRILLRVATEVTEIDPTISINYGFGAVPAFRTRKNETSVELPSGGSIVSAGLMQTTTQASINGLPGLMNLPILGTLFRSRDYQRQETELMIVVTPYIAKASKPSEIARPTDGFSDATDPQAVLLGRVNKIYSTTDNPQVIQGFKGHVGFIAD